MTRFVDHVVRARNIDPTADNKIHDDDVARTFGFSGALVPGVELFAYLTNPLVQAWGVDFLSGGAVAVRFRRPVYDGEEVVAHASPGDADGEPVLLELRGPDGSVRSAGSAALRAVAGDVSPFVDSPLPASLPPATAEALRPGPLGSVTEEATAAAAEEYLAAISEPLPLYRTQRILHPGALLRVVNALLMRNVRLGPWIHTASSCSFLGVAHLPSTLQAHGVVTRTYERNGHEYVDYDALVLSDGRPVVHVAHTAIYSVAASS